MLLVDSAALVNSMLDPVGRKIIGGFTLLRI
jgi:hypothetical protein